MQGPASQAKLPSNSQPRMTYFLQDLNPDVESGTHIEQLTVQVPP